MLGTAWHFNPSKRTLDLSDSGDSVWIGCPGDAYLYISCVHSGTGTITLYGFDEHLSGGTALGTTFTSTGQQTLDVAQYAWLQATVTSATSGAATIGYSREALP